MVSLPTVKAFNASYAPSYIPTAVFVGGTGGIGRAMAELLAKRTKGRANIIIVGRNRAAGESVIAGFPAPPTEEGVSIKHEFIQCDVSELKNVHQASQELLKRLDKINFLVLTPSANSFSAVPTSEGLERMMVLRYYARAKFIHELLPLLLKAKARGEDAKAMSVLGAAMGGKVDLDDLGLKKRWSIFRMAFQTGTFTDILVKVQSERNPNIAFMHIYPGTVDTAAFNFHWIFAVVRPFVKYFIWSADDCAENMMYPLLSSEFSTGGYWLSQRAEKKTLGAYVTDDIVKKVWDHTVEVAQLQ